MFKKKLLVGVPAVLAGLMLAGSAMAANGGSLYQSKGCMACHGAKGAKPLSGAYPVLAGQHEQYLLTQMKDIKSGARSNGMTAVMKPIISNVSEKEMAAIAKWLSQQSR